MKQAILLEDGFVYPGWKIRFFGDYVWTGRFLRLYSNGFKVQIGRFAFLVIKNP